MAQPKKQTDKKPNSNAARKPAATSRRLPRFEFVTSAVDLAGCPVDTAPEIALAGRSNAGKSAFINALAGGTIARVSSAPGKTRLLNFYQASSGYRLVDMPGYGYAARSAGERDGWAEMIEPYLCARETLAGALILMDIRRNWASEELALLRWLEPLGIPCAVALTKADKVTRSERAQAIVRVKKASALTNVFATSALKKTGIGELEDFFYRAWIKPRQKSGQKSDQSDISESASS